MKNYTAELKKSNSLDKDTKRIIHERNQLIQVLVQKTKKIIQLEETVNRLGKSLEAEKANRAKLEQSSCENEDTILSLSAQLDGYKNIFRKIETHQSMESDSEEYTTTLEDELSGLDSDFTGIWDQIDAEPFSSGDSQRRARNNPVSIDLVYAHF